MNKQIVCFSKKLYIELKNSYTKIILSLLLISMQTLKYQIGKIIGILLTVMGVTFTSVIFVAIFGDDPDRDKTILGGIILGVIPLLTGLLLWRTSRNGERKFLMNKYERQILELAFKNEGHLTPAELAMKTDLTLKESKKVLETMQIEDYAELKISPSGAIVFYFRELDKGDSYKDSELLN